MGLQLFAIEKVKKYDGNVVDFVPEKISTSIFDVVNDTNIDKKIDKESADILTHKVGGILEYQCNSSKIPTTDDIKHSIAIVLKNAGYAGAAEVFWPCHKKKLGARGTLIDAKELIDSYAGGKDWRIKENSNESYSFSGLLLFTAGRVVNRYALNEIYSPEIKEAHVNGYFHIHDLNNAIICYCCGWSLKNLLLLGLGGVPNKIDCKPAKHLSTVVHHMINFIGCVQMENAGAQAFSSVDTYLAPFVKNGNLSYKETKQAIQQLVFSFNIPSRWGSQTPFTNLTFDWTVPDDLANEKAIVGGKPQEFTYGDCTREMGMINKAFLEVLLEGDAKGRVFTWPIPTYNLTKDFDWDSENANLLFDVTSKFGLPYFQNYIGSDLDPKSIRAMCCRMNLNLNELLKRPGGMWGPGDSTGSIGVVTINLNRLGYEAKDKESYFEKLGHYMLLAKQSLETKRKIIDQNLSRGLMPYTKRYLGSFGNHFSTIGLCGMNEACLNFLGKDISTEEGVQFTIETLNFMREQLVGFQQETMSLYNLEATPAESTSHRLAYIDKRLYPDIITAGCDVPFLTNSTYLPVDKTDDIIEAVEHQNRIQHLYTGGTMFHTFLGEKVSSGKACKNLVKKIAQNSRLPYFSITPTFSVCPDHGYIRGEVASCPKCGVETEVYSRIVGYYRPIRQWNQGKKEEYNERKEYTEESIGGQSWSEKKDMMTLEELAYVEDTAE